MCFCICICAITIIVYTSNSLSWRSTLLFQPREMFPQYQLRYMLQIPCYSNQRKSGILLFCSLANVFQLTNGQVRNRVWYYSVKPNNVHLCSNITHHGYTIWYPCYTGYFISIVWNVWPWYTIWGQNVSYATYWLTTRSNFIFVLTTCIC